jgi:hypothetical protein
MADRNFSCAIDRPVRFIILRTEGSRSLTSKLINTLCSWPVNFSSGYRNVFPVLHFHFTCMNWNIAVGIATGFGLGDRGFGVESSRVKNFHFSTSSKPTLGPTHPPIQWVPRPLSPGVKRKGREADHSPQTSAEVKKCGPIHLLPHTRSWRRD